jgi:hypothetical protein
MYNDIALADGSTYRLNQGAYAVTDLMAGYQVSPHLDLQLNANNVFDRTTTRRSPIGGLRWRHLRRPTQLHADRQVQLLTFAGAWMRRFPSSVARLVYKLSTRLDSAPFPASPPMARITGRNATLCGLAAILLWSTASGLIRSVSQAFRRHWRRGADLHPGRAVAAGIAGQATLRKASPWYLLGGSALFVAYEICLSLALGYALTAPRRSS